MADALKLNQQKKFEEALNRIEARQKRYEARQADKPRKDFFRSGLKCGFTDSQLKFMWAWLAKSDHSHWNGMVG